MQRASKKVSEKPVERATFRCKFCKKVFQTYPRYTSHLSNCPMKARYEAENTPTGDLGHKLWSISFHKTNRKKFDFSDFVAHKEYEFFMKLAAFCVRLNAIHPEQYMEWCIKERVAFKLWTTEKVYERFVKYFVQHEEPVNAVIRSINYIERVKKETNVKDFFSSISSGSLLSMIEMGRVSPWLLMLYKHTNKAVSRMSDIQKDRYKEIVDSNIWSILIKRHKDTCQEIQLTLKHEVL